MALIEILLESQLCELQPSELQVAVARFQLQILFSSAIAHFHITLAVLCSAGSVYVGTEPQVPRWE
jgi:hypothetical protein